MAVQRGPPGAPGWRLIWGIGLVGISILRHAGSSELLSLDAVAPGGGMGADLMPNIWFSSSSLAAQNPKPSTATCPRFDCPTNCTRTSSGSPPLQPATQMSGIATQPEK